MSVAPCRGCGEQHEDDVKICPGTKRPVDEGSFGLRVGPYQVGKLLGAGGFGAVYLAEDTRTEEKVALKLLHPEFVSEGEMLDRFAHEAEATVRAGNPHIVRVLETSFSRGAVYVALELLAGETLANVLRAGPFDPARAVDVAVQALDGLALAHAAGVIHRDIKPANIFLADEGDAPCSLVKILDFGVGRMLMTDPARRLTRTGTRLGTPHFMAPEQVSDAKRADHRADLYALAATLFGMLTTERPYGNIAVADWLGAVARGIAPRRVSAVRDDLPPALVDAIAIGLAVKPEERYQDAGAFAGALLDAMSDTPMIARSLPALAASKTFTQRLSSPAQRLSLPATVRAKRVSDPASAQRSEPPVSAREAPVEPRPRRPSGVMVFVAVSLGAAAIAGGYTAYMHYAPRAGETSTPRPASATPSSAPPIPVIAAPAADVPAPAEIADAGLGSRAETATPLEPNRPPVEPVHVRAIPRLAEPDAGPPETPRRHPNTGGAELSDPWN